MTTNHLADGGEKGLLLGRLADLVSESEGEWATAPLFESFLKHYYSHASASYLRNHPPEALLKIVASHWQLLQQYLQNQGRPAVQVLSEESCDTELGGTLVQTVMPDQPFLVDTLSIILRRHSASISAIHHPLIQLQCTEAGQLTALLGEDASTSDSSPVSLVCMEIPALLDEIAATQLQADITTAMADLQCVVADWEAMKEQLYLAAIALDKLSDNDTLEPEFREETSEAAEFLRWLDDHHFTFLGSGKTDRQEDAQGVSLAWDVGSARGLLRETASESAKKFHIESSETARYADSSRVLVITKDRERSFIHHAERMDSVAVKRFDDQGRIIGTLRFIGLFSDEAYRSSPRRIPLLNRKMKAAISLSSLRAGSHRAKAFLNILEGLPRDELLQSSETELNHIAETLLAEPEQLASLLFLRADRYQRFVTAMLWLPKDRYSRAACDVAGQILCAGIGAHAFSFEVDFLRGNQAARIYFLFECGPQQCEALDELLRERLQAQLVDALKSWSEQLRDSLMATLGRQGGQLWSRYHRMIPIEYSSTVSANEAAIDFGCLEQLDGQRGSIPRLLQDDNGDLRLKIFRVGQAIPLSQVLPTLENFGFTVLQQTPYVLSETHADAIEISSESAVTTEAQISIHEFGVQLAHRQQLSGELVQQFEDAWAQCAAGLIENDRLNSLILLAGLDAREVALLRCLSRYLLQMGLPYSREFVETTLSDSQVISSLLVELFSVRFDPADVPERDAKSENLLQKLHAAIDQVDSLDQDRVLRNLMHIVLASIRTNYFQRSPDDQAKAWISIKLRSAALEELPEPKPLYETFVCSPQMEGVHLRAGKVARGGLRWSDRHEDYRTEVLGLVKAQMVKNAVIVPLGAKGGFVLKEQAIEDGAGTEKVQAVNGYRLFIRGLLDLCDNQVQGEIQSPAKTVCYDDEDPYLVVAADKGTATFSDVANSISEEYGYWLGDAFASGGSAGYDHKKMGITAKGAWVSVQQHFAEMAVDCQAEPFTVVGIGDMAGDVFGNGMLLSPHIRLVAAFNHQHIFLDPNPDAKTSFSERQRLFAMERSSWTDYDLSLISEGGGIWRRNEKSVPISDAVRAALDIDAQELSPDLLIRAILRAPVDLLWNGGIGTYVKASVESALDVGDRANDGLRINARELRCRIVGEGGNLGLTQLARIEFAQAGGRINADFIDNSGGVNSSDREVNLKIPLNKLTQAGELTMPARNELLESMTEDVSSAVLADSLAQAQALSVMEFQAAGRLDESRNLLRLLERDTDQYQGLDRALECLPGDDEIDERRRAGQGLVRPELAVIQSWAKMSLYQELLNSEVPDEAYFDRRHLSDFPGRIQQEYSEAFLAHPLRRELVATHLANDLVHRMGSAFAHRTAEEDGVALARVVRAFELARGVYQADALWRRIENLPLGIAWPVRAELLIRVSRLMKFTTQWFLEHESGHEPVAAVAERYTDAVSAFKSQVRDWLTDDYLQSWERTRDRHHAAGIEFETAGELAAMKFMGAALDVADISILTSEPVELVGQIHLRVGIAFSLPWLVASTVNMKVDGRWPALARATVRDEAYRLHRELTLRALSAPGEDALTRLEVWLYRNQTAQQFARRRISELATAEAQDFATLTVALRELRNLL